MASDHMASVEPWSQIRQPFLDPWFAELFSRENDAFTKSLSSDDPLSRFSSPQTETAPTPAVSGVSASSDQESAPKRRHKPIPVTAAAPRGGRVAKRKSRASKRSQTTFITADAANFRQMVQQVTGVRFGGPLKPEPQRATGRLLPPGAGATAGGGCVRTLDAASAWRQNSGGAFGLIAAPAAADSGMAGALSFESAGSFPTLESWKVI